MRYYFSSFILFLLLAASCSNSKPSKNPTWWKEAVFYQIYMPSYADSNGDGYSDFAGMTSKLDYLQSLGVQGLWLTPFLQSPKVDNGYDVADYYTIDTVYGTQADFEHFLAEAHCRGIKVIMDMVLNHTSTDCYWFRESRKGKDNPYRDYYVWTDTPNNWESLFGGPAWQWDSLSQQYYYHKFDVRMADLNWSNPAVVAEVQKVLRHWLDLGVDGFRLDVINFLLTDGIGPDNPMEEGKQQHLHDIGQPGVKEAMRIIRNTVDEYPDKFIVGEIGSDKIEVLKQYQGEDLMHVIFNFNFGSMPSFSLTRIMQELQSMEQEMENYPTLFFGSHDMPRMLNRLAGGSTDRALALAALTLTAKGVPFVYYGEEIGMQNIVANTLDEMVDVQGHINYQLSLQAGKSAAQALEVGNGHNRDKSRSPMQWSAAAFAGFSTVQPWIKVHPGYPQVNVEACLADSTSIWHQYQQLIQLRNSHKVLQYGQYTELACTDSLLHFTRTYQGEQVHVAINFACTPQHVDVGVGTIIAGSALVQPNRWIIYK